MKYIHLILVPAVVTCLIVLQRNTRSTQIMDDVQGASHQSLDK